MLKQWLQMLILTLSYNLMNVVESQIKYKNNLWIIFYWIIHKWFVYYIFETVFNSRPTLSGSNLDFLKLFVELSEKKF